MRYFDHNASSPLCAAAREAWLDAQERFPANPSSLHRMGARAGVALDGVREEMAGYLGCNPGDLIFCSGATEANNAVVWHFAHASVGEAWVSAVEHPSVLEPVRQAFAGRYRLIPVGRDGRVDLGWLAENLKRERPAFVGVMAVNNETGVIQPWREVGKMCREVEVPFFCDAVQVFGKDPSGFDVLPDYLVGCAHKFGGPKGVGFLKVGRAGGVGGVGGVGQGGRRFRGLLLGGPQEEGRRAGTENLAGISAMWAALRDRLDRVRMPGFLGERLRWRSRFEARLMSELGGITVVGWQGSGEESGRGGEEGGGGGAGGGQAGVGQGKSAECLSRNGKSGMAAGSAGLGRDYQSGYERRSVALQEWAPDDSGWMDGRVWNTSMLILPAVDCRQRWVVKLDRLGVAVSTGSACATGKEESSHVLRAMGFTERESGLAVRVSSAWETTEQDWLDLAERFLDAATQLGVRTSGL